MQRFTIDHMRPPLSEVVALQSLAFPPPFSEELHWKEEHLATHIDVFPEGQWIALSAGSVVGSCSNCILTESDWSANRDWYQTVGGPNIKNHHPLGTTLFGLDITVHPQHRKIGIGRAFYENRFQFARNNGLRRFGTGCRVPDFLNSGHSTVEAYVKEVVAGIRMDRTLTPLLRYGLRFIAVRHNYMDDPESGDSAAILEWEP